MFDQDGDGYPAETEFDFGTGPIPGPYGHNAEATPGRVIRLGVQPEPVPAENVVGPLPPGNFRAPVGAYSDVDWVSLPTGSLVTVEFVGEEIFDGPGPDLAVVSLGAGGSERAELRLGPAPDHLFPATEITEAGDVPIDLAALGIAGPVRFVQLRGLDTLGTSPGYDLVGFVALNYRSRGGPCRQVTVAGGQPVAVIAFDRSTFTQTLRVTFQNSESLDAWLGATGLTEVVQPLSPTMERVNLVAASDLPIQFFRFVSSIAGSGGGNGLPTAGD